MANAKEPHIRLAAPAGAQGGKRLDLIPPFRGSRR
jgi:hypothetical protein